MDATTVDRKAHDEKTAELESQLEAAGRRLASVIDQAHRVAGDKKLDRWTRNERWGMSGEAVYDAIRTRADAHPIDEAVWGGDHPVSVVHRWDTITAEMARLADEITVLDRIYDAQPWQRFFPCNTSNGHIHASLACHTLNKGQYRTQMSWYPSLSGHTVDEAVAELGTWLCSFCFPGAPAEHCQTRSEATRAEREAKRAAAAEAKFDKALRPEEIFRDGRIGHSGRGDTVTTKAGAIEVLREVSQLRHYSGINQHHPWYQPTLAAAEDAKAVLLAREARKPGTGATQAEIDLIMKRAEQKARKEAGGR
jgi:hypothetical protein